MFSRSQTRRNSSQLANKTARIILSMTARYVGACPCGALIDVGDTIQYDTLSHKAYCFNCGRKRKSLQESAIKHNEQIDENKMQFESQPLIERFRILKSEEIRLKTKDDKDAYPGIRLELSTLLQQFEREHAGNPEVRKLVTEFIRCHTEINTLSLDFTATTVHDFIAIAAKFQGKCFHCERFIQTGWLCLYDRSSKRLHCLICDCL